MKKVPLLILIISFFTVHPPLFSEEGMWIPLLLNQLNMDQMQKAGLRLSAEEIYSVNHSSLKDAIVRFGRGCTGEVVSPNGLLLTNHHCGYGTIQRLSSLEHDYLTDGYWAGSLEEEIPGPGLTVTFLVRMEDVTTRVLEGITGSMTEQERTNRIRAKIREIETEAVKDTHYEANVRAFFSGNQYYLLVSETFRDIRFVGAPPSDIGKFGGDTDNWVWPRHTGDFSVFRIYADTHNLPADYSSKNVPYKPRYFLPVSLDGYKEGDFTLLFGYPGTTREYLPSVAVDLIALKENPIRIGLRQKRLDIIGDAMEKSRLVQIQYASKHAAIANNWKKMIGETRGIQQIKAIGKKQEFEKEFEQWAASGRCPDSGYAGILPLFKQLYLEFYPIDICSVYLTEAGMAPELFRFTLSAKELMEKSGKKKTPENEIFNAVTTFKENARNFFKDYQPAVDEKITCIMLEEMKAHMDSHYLPDIFSTIGTKFHGDIPLYVSWVFRNSVLLDSSCLFRILNEWHPRDHQKLEKDPAFQLAKSIDRKYSSDIYPLMQNFSVKIDSLQRIYMQARMQMLPDRIFFPDANSTMRISYGTIAGFKPADAVEYNYFTTVEGILGKEDTTVNDYTVDNRLRDLIVSRDFGPYTAQDGSLHVAFVSTIHSTGGNSGAPVMNAQGELIGLNFDRNWEGTMSDLMYDPGQCRNIVLDIRYLLFIIEKYAKATRLISEMEIRSHQPR